LANYWDTIKNAIASKIGEGLSAVGENVAAGFAGSFAGRIAPGADTTQVSAAAAAPIRQAGKRITEPLVNIAAKPAETIKADALFNLGIQEATDLYELVWPKVTRPIATAALTTKQLGRFEIPNIPANYELAKNISPAQAAFSDVPLLFNKEFNIADPTDRKETFEKNIFGKVATGSADGLLSWYLDPLFVAGKGLALGRKGLLIKPIEKAEDIVNLRKDLDQHGFWLESQKIKQTVGAQAEAATKVVPQLPKDYSLVRADNPEAMGLVANLNVVKDGKTVGSINWDVNTKVVNNIELVGSERGKNIAQAIWAEAKKIEPGLKHSEYRTPEGDKFAFSTGDLVPPLKPMGDSWTDVKLAEAEARAAKAVQKADDLGIVNVGRETPIGTAVASLVGKSITEISSHPLIRKSTNPRLLTALISESKTYDEAADFIAAAAGDRASMARIAATRASVADEIQRAQDLLDPVTRKYVAIEWGANTPIEKLEPTIQEYDRLTKVLDDLKLRDENLARAMDERLGDYRVINDYTSAADVNLFNKNIGVAIEKARARGSELRNDFSFYTETFQKTPFARPVAVIQAAFNKLPRGIVRVDGGPVADSANEIKYALNSVPVLRRAEYLDKKTELFAEYSLARNATERLKAVENIEEEVANIIALENGLSLEEATMWYKQFGVVRRGLMNGISTNGFWVGDSGELITSPFWKSEMANVVPMMDFNDFNNFLKLYKRLAYRPEGAIKAGLTARQIGQEFEDALDFANSLFKASVLTRMGYPIRNTIDGQLRAALALGAIAKTDEVLKTFKQNVGTRVQQVENFFDETLSATRPSQLNTQVGKLIQQRGEIINVRESILDELTPQNYYAGASGTFGKQVTPEMVELSITSKTKPLLSDSNRNAYFDLMAKRKKQKGLLFSDDKVKFEKLQRQAFSRYVREEVVPTLPKGTDLVYADYLSGKVFYKIPGKQGRLPKGAVPEIEARRGIPSGMLADDIESVGALELRGKGPVQYPDIRVITSYEVSRAENFEEIASILGEDNMMRIRYYQDLVNKIDNEILQKVEQSQFLNQRRVDLGIIRAGEGEEVFMSPNGRKVVADGAFAGPNGSLTRAEASSEGSLNWLTEGQAYLSFDAAKGSKGMTSGLSLGEARVVVNPGDPQYFNEMAVFANQRLRNDQLAMQILEGLPDSKIIEWLKSPKGTFYVKEINADISKVDIPAHVKEARSRIYKLFPDQQVRSLIAREELSPEQFDLLMRGTPNLVPVAGRSLLEDTLRYNKGVLKTVVNDTIAKIFKVIGSTPENNLVAWPFYNKLYKKNLQQEIDLAEGLGKNIQDPDFIIQMQRTAHAASQRTLKDVLYRVTNNTGLSNTMRFLVPFFNAQYNAVKVYGKFFIEDPSRIARAQQLWNLPNRVATVVDQEGKEVPPGAPPSTSQFLLFTIPEGVQGRFGIPKGYQISIPKNSLNVFLTGDNPLAPSFGVPVTIPVAVVANSRPDKVEDVRVFLEDFFGEETSKAIMNSVIPFGRAPSDPWKLLLPAAGQKFASLQAGLDDPAYAYRVASAMKTLRNEWEQAGSVGKQPNFQDAIKLADQQWKIRIAANLTLPFTFSFRPEWQIVMDDYRAALLDPSVGKTKVDDYIREKYGDLGYLLTAPTSKNKTNLVPTIGAVVNERKYRPLLGEMDKLNVPGLVGFIANYGNNSDKYSDAAANYFRNKNVRPGGEIKYTESRATEDIITDREESLGWNYYEKFSKQRDAMLAKYGLKSVNSQAAQQMGITAKWEAAVQSIKDYLPSWSEAYDNSIGDYTKTKRYVKGLLKTLNNETWMKEYGNTPTMLAVKDYVLNRDYVANELAKRKKYLGSAGLGDAANADLKDKWDEYIINLKLYDTGFSDLYTRYLENDNYEVIEVKK
jgi:hypothetical protein